MRTSRFAYGLGLCVCLLVLVARPMVSGDNQPDAAASKELVRAALQAEVNHDASARQAALEQALATAPAEVPAHWHAGHVRVGNAWVSLIEAESKVATDPKLIEYRRVRELQGNSLDGQIALARWCRKQNLSELEQLHWESVMQLSPGNKEAHSRLGLQEFQGKFLAREQIDQFKEQLGALEIAKKEWKPRVERWRTALTGRDAAAWDSAIDELRAVRDVVAIPFLEQILSTESTEGALEVIGVLHEIKDQAATDSLVRHAVLANDVQVRECAALALKERSLYAYVPALLGTLQTPVEYSYAADTYHIEGPNVVFESTPINAATGNGFFNVPWKAKRDQNALAVNRFNFRSEIMNQRTYGALRIATSQRNSDKPGTWWNWWEQYNELASTSQYLPQKGVVHTYHRGASRAYHEPVESSPPFHTVYSRPGSGRYVKGERIPLSCFSPGTRVWLDTGSVPIEKVRVGDRVLSQNQESGEVTYKVVLHTTVRPPSPTLRILVPGEEIATTLGHPIWVVGKGWRMAKEIVVGDYLHGIQGGVRVASIEKGPDSNAYNLVVADFNTYCIGEHRILVHDNMPRLPSLALIPGFIADRALAAE